MRFLIASVLRAALLFALVLRSFAQAVYVPGYTTSNVAGYIVDPSTGALSGISGMPLKTGTSPVQAAIHPSGKVLYVVDAGSKDITLFEISAPSGALSVVPCANCDATSPSGIAIDSAGRLLFVTNLEPGTVTPYLIDASSGALRKLPPVTTGVNSKPVQAMVDPTATYLYVADANGYVAGFAINGGSLAPVPGSPFVAGAGPSGIAVSQTAVYVSNQFSGDISAYRIASGGALIPDGLPTPVGGSPASIAVDPTGTNIYVANQSQLVALNTTRNGLYPLTYLRAYNAGTVPSFVAVDPSGTYVYVVNTISNDVYGFLVSAGGTLIPVGSASTTGVLGSRMLTVGHIGDPTAISLSTGSPFPPSGSSFGTPVTVSGSIVNRRNASVTPTGSVSLLLNGTVGAGTTELDTHGTFRVLLDGSTSFLPVGGDVIQITYNAGVGFEAPAPLRFSYSVNKVAPAMTVTVPPSPAVNQVMNVTASMQQIGSKVPTGRVEAFLDGLSIGKATLNNGLAAFSITPTAGSHSLTAMYEGDSIFLSGNGTPISFRAKYVTATVVTASTTAVSYGDSPVLTVQVTTSGTVGVGAVDVFDNGTKINSSPLTLTGGVARMLPNLMLPGLHQIKAQFSGDLDNLASSNASAPFLLTVTRAAPQVSISQGSGIASGSSLSFSITASGSNALAVAPSGFVTVMDGTTTVGTATLVNGAAPVAVAQLPPGPHTMSAAYSGDSNYSAAISSTLSLMIAKKNPVIAVTTAPVSPVAGQTVTVTAIVSGFSPVTGTVDLYDSGSKITSAAIPLSNGKASYEYSVATAGRHVVTASYSGDTNNNGGDTTAAPLTLIVGQAQASVVLTSSGLLVFGQQLTLTARLSPVGPSAGAPTGSIVFKDGTVSLGTAAVSGGVASLWATLASAGSHILSASYSGDSNFASSASPLLNITEGKAAVTATLSVSQSHTATVLTVSVAGVGNTFPTGTVTFFLNNTEIGVAPVLLAANGAVASLAAGVIVGVVSAVYEGDANYQSAYPVSSTISVLPRIAVTMGFSVTPNPATVIQPVRCILSISGAADEAVSGTITIADGATTIITVPATPTASIQASLDAGYHVLTATYSGDSHYLAASATVAITVNRAAPTAALFADDTVKVFGQTLSLTASFGVSSTMQLPPPSGIVQFIDGSTLIATTPLVNSAATAATAALEPGPHQIKAVYSGDPRWQPITTSPVQITVAKAATRVEVGASVDSAGSGGTLLTAKLAVILPGSGTPTGWIEFLDSVTYEVIASGAVSSPTTNVIAPSDLRSRQVVAAYRGDSQFLGSSSYPATGLAVVNGASFLVGAVAPGEIATVFVQGMTTEVIEKVSSAPAPLGGIAITVLDASGSAHDTELLYVSPKQLSMVVPENIALGPCVIRITTVGGDSWSTITEITADSPGIFTADASGRGPAAAQIVRVHSDGTQDAPANTSLCTSVSQCVTSIISPAADDESIYLILYGTGLRERSSSTSVLLNGTELPVSYAGPHSIYPGLDQVNVLIPRWLQTGDLKVELVVDGTASNSAVITFGHS